MTTDAGTPREELRSLIERYCTGWERVIGGSGDVDGLNSFFHLPCIFVGADGSAALFRAPADISAFHRPRLDLFRKSGGEKLRNRDFDVVQMGARSALISVTWVLCRADDSIARSWRHSYNVINAEAGWKILVSTFQAGA